jgi:hypothetical protein
MPLFSGHFDAEFVSTRHGCSASVSDPPAGQTWHAIKVAVGVACDYFDGAFHVNETRVWMRNRDGSGALGGFRPLSRPSCPETHAAG